MNELSLKQLTYVQNRVARHMNCADAARAAGYGRNYARKAAELIESQAPIKAAIDKARNEVREATRYTAEKIIAEISDNIKFARENRSPMAAMKGLELIAKMTGLLVERVQIDLPNVGAALEAARARALLSKEVIDAEHHEVLDALPPPNPFE